MKIYHTQHVHIRETLRLWHRMKLRMEVSNERNRLKKRNDKRRHKKTQSRMLPQKEQWISTFFTIRSHHVGYTSLRWLQINILENFILKRLRFTVHSCNKQRTPICTSNKNISLNNSCKEATTFLPSVNRRCCHPQTLQNVAPHPNTRL